MLITEYLRGWEGVGELFCTFHFIVLKDKLLKKIRSINFFKDIIEEAKLQAMYYVK